MAITIHKQPQLLQPVYNEIIFVVSSDNSVESNFTFVSEIIVDSNVIATIHFPVNPSGYGILDIHKHLQTQISTDFNNTSSIAYAYNSNTTYEVNFAESFSPTFNFENNVNISGQVAFTSIANPNDLFAVTDIINVSQTGGYTHGSYNGVATIVNIAFNGTSSRWETTVNKPYKSATTGEGGTFTLSNQRTKTYPVEHTINNLVAYNGVETFIDFIDYDSDIYTNDLTTSTPIGKLLTNLPYNVNSDVNAPFTYINKIKRSSKFWINSFTRTHFDLVIEVDGVYYVLHKSAPYDSNENVIQYGVGVNQLNTSTDIYKYELVGLDYVLVPATQPIIPTNITTYKVYGGVLHPEYEGDIDPESVVGLYKQGYTFNIEDVCSKYDDIQLVFLDKKGSFASFHFDLVNKHTKEIERTNYQTEYGKYATATNSFTYNTYDRGVTRLNTKVTDKYVINSNWVNQKTSDWLMTLVESPTVFWITEDDIAIAINLTTNSIERKQVINEQIINYTFSFELSQKNKQQTA